MGWAYSRCLRLPPTYFLISVALVPNATRRCGQYFLNGQKVLKKPPGVPDAVAASRLVPATHRACTPWIPDAENRGLLVAILPRARTSLFSPHPPLDEQRGIRVNSGSGAKWHAQRSMNGLTPNLRPRSPGGFSGDSFSRQKESRPPRRVAFGKQWGILRHIGSEGGCLGICIKNNNWNYRNFEIPPFPFRIDWT